MNKNRRSSNLLAAGTLMGLLVATFFLFDSGSLQKVLAAQFSSMSLTADESAPAAIDAAAVNQGLVTTLQAQNAALGETIQTLQAREVEYRATIEKANQTLQQFESDSSAKLANANGAASTVAQSNQELQQAVQTLQGRETQYRTQVDTANQTIHQLEAAVQEWQVGMQTLQNQNAELVKAVQLMQERERQYQAQLQAATLVVQSNSAPQQASTNNNNNSGGGYSEHDEHDEHDEYDEHEEHDDD